MLAPASNAKIMAVSFNGKGGPQVQVRSDDQLAVEEPLEISIICGKEGERSARPISVTMCTPGHEKELALGFLFTEGILHSLPDILSVETPRLSRHDRKVCVELNPSVTFDPSRLERHFYTSSSCGICGKSSVNAVKLAAAPLEFTDGPELSVTAATLISLPPLLRARQELFASTGGIHAAAVFDAEGNLLLLREDVGRHNALDKLVGAALMENRLPLNQHILLLSGRASFELLQKAHMAGIRIVCAVGAPSSLAVETAEECGITLVGFLRENRFNIYSHTNRIMTGS